MFPLPQGRVLAMFLPSSLAARVFPLALLITAICAFAAPPYDEVAIVRSALGVSEAVGFSDRGAACVFGVSAGLGLFTLKLVPALNGAPHPAVSLLGLGNSASARALGDNFGFVLAANASTACAFLPAAAADPDAATWSIVPGLSDPSNFSLSSASRDPAARGRFLTRLPPAGTACAGRGDAAGLSDGGGALAGAATFVLGPPPPPPPRALSNVAVDAGNVTHRLSRRLLGCHFDNGYEFQPRLLHAQLLYGDSFQCGPELACAWSNLTVGAGDAHGSASLDASVHVNEADPAPALRVVYASPAGTGGAVGWVNRGIGNEGLSLEGGKPYEGLVVVLAPAGATLYVSANDYLAGQVLASAALSVPPAPAWQIVHFTLTPAAGTACARYPYVQNTTLDCGPQGTNPAHICVRCAGEFGVGLAAPGAAHIGYAQFGPGAWGRFRDQPVLATGAALLQALGYGAVRWGGHIARITKWKDWRGLPWARASMQLDDAKRFISAGFGIFEFVDLAAALGIYPVISLSKAQDAGDFADLIEYAWGNDTTPWGAVRAFNDSHPDVYNVTAVELGNEEANPDFLAQVLAMEARRKRVGAPPFFYIYPSDGGVDNATASALLAAGVPPRAIAPDAHIDGSGGALSTLINDFAKLPGFYQSGINAEINALDSVAGRLSLEAADLQKWFNYGAGAGEDPTRLIARTTSFCSARCGHVEPPWADQGLALFLPNGTVLVQPVGLVHAMLAPPALQLNALRVVADGGVSASAQLSDDGADLVVQLVNVGDGEAPVRVAVSGFAPAGGAGRAATLNATDVWGGNTAEDPQRVAPWEAALPWAGGGFSLTLPPNSFVVATATRAAANASG